MPTLFLMSALDTYSKDENGNRITHNFGNENHILDNFKKHIKKYDNFLFVASSENDFERTEMYAKLVFESFDKTLPFKNYQILDGRTKADAEKLVLGADFIFLCGGHVPSQNSFFNNINLKDVIHRTKGVVCGGSAGSMNAAEIVYAQPELDGETQDPNFQKYIPGLALTSINIMPHFDENSEDMLDGLHVFKDIMLPDSKVRPFVGFPDESYILQTSKGATLYGKGYYIANGTCYQINRHNQMLDLTAFLQINTKTRK